MLSVVCDRKCQLVAQDVIHTDTPSSLYLLFRSFFVLLTHVHDGGCGRTIELITVHALEILLDLVGHTPMLSDSTVR